MPSLFCRMFTFAALVLVLQLAQGAAAALSSSELRCLSVPLPANALIETTAIGDVTGDGARDLVYLIGEHAQLDTPFATSHLVMIRNGEDGTVLRYGFGANSGGFSGTLALADVTGDRAQDILIGLPTGGSGGIVNYYLLSAAGGRVRQLISSEKLTLGAQMSVTLRNNYQAEFAYPQVNIETTVDLRKGKTPQELREIYNGVYTPGGRLLKSTTGVVDPYGMLTPVDPDGNGVYDLAGYQSAWMLFHANRIANVTSRWQWQNNRLALTHITAGNQPDLDDYRRFLRQLNAQNTASVAQAIDWYTTKLADVPPGWRDSAFLIFRAWHRHLVERENAAFQQEFERVGRAYRERYQWAYNAQRDYALTFNRTPRAQALGIAAVDVGEGFYQVVPREYFYLNRFGRTLTPMVRDFLLLEQREENKPWSKDAGIIIPREDVGRILRGWETFLDRYPETFFAQEATQYYRFALLGFLLGSNNTPNFDFETNRILPEVHEAFRWYRNTYPDSQTTAYVRLLERIFAENNDVMTARAEAAVAEINKVLTPSDAPSAYFPLFPGSVWRYPTGGFEQAGFTNRITFRRGNRAQLDTQDTGALRISVYETRPDAVVEVYREGEATTAASRLDQPNNANFALIANPLRKGVAWMSDGKRNTVLATNQIINVLGRSYPFTLVIERIANSATASYTITDYYALGVGLIKREYRGSSLSDALLCDYQPGLP